MNSKENKILYWIFISVGLLITIISSIFFVPNLINNNDKIFIDAVVSNIVEKDDETIVYVEYEIYDIITENKLPYSTSLFSKGDKIKIYYYIDNIEKIGCRKLDYFTLFVPGIGLIFLVIGLIIFIFNYKRNNLINYLLENGQRAFVPYEKIIVNKNVEVNNRNPVKIVCKKEDLNSKIKSYKSDNIWEKKEIVEKVIEELNITGFYVYHLHENEKKYFVDIQEILTYIKENKKTTKKQIKEK